RLPIRMVDVLHAARGIDTAGLDVHVRIGRDAHLRPRRRDTQMQRPLAQLAPRPGLSLRVEIRVAAPVTDAAHDEVVAFDSLQSGHCYGEIALGGVVAKNTK